MSLHLLLVWLHLVTAVVLTGFALYWAILRLALPRLGLSKRMPELLAAAHGARWPHVGLPFQLRLPVPWLGLLATLFLAATGLLLGEAPADVLLWRAKLLLVGLLLFVQLAFLVRVTDWTLLGQLPLALLVVLLSALAIRS
ncbi:hypothetical protein HRbin40_02384 [bacterium HR40]|nr:hypothetical protein HRbin40_02384 [bacterium HR40]